MFSIKKSVHFLIFLLFFVSGYIMYLFINNGFKAPVWLYIYNDRFEPSQIKIYPHTEVVFVNKSSSSVWPASDTHPTHEIYAELDPRGALLPHETWSFMFEEVGEWRIHDHLRPHKTGKIIVTEDLLTIIVPPSPFSQMSHIFKNFGFVYKTLEALVTRHQQSDKFIGGNEFSELSEKQKLSALEILSDEQGSEEVWFFIKDTYPAQSGTSGPVHDLAHLAGQLLFKEHGFSGFSVCSPEFAFGCYHGFLDVAFEDGLDKLSDSENACKSTGLPGSGPYASCIHGIGHGIASYYKVADLDQALLACEEISQGNEYCFDGVFMEFARETANAFYNKKDPLYPCNSVNEKYVYSCGRNQVGVMQSRFGLSFEEISLLCSSYSHASLQESCFEALGFQAAYQASSDPAKVFHLCSTVDTDDLVAKCVTSAAGELIFQNMQGWQKNASELCDLLGGENNTRCHDRIAQIKSDYRR